MGGMQLALGAFALRAAHYGTESDQRFALRVPLPSSHFLNRIYIIDFTLFHNFFGVCPPLEHPHVLIESFIPKDGAYGEQRVFLCPSEAIARRFSAFQRLALHGR